MRILISTMTALLTISAMLLTTGCKNYDDDISKLNSSLESANTQITALSDKVSSLESSVIALSAGIAALETETDANTEDIKELEDAIDALDDAIQEAYEDIEELKEAVKSQLSEEKVQAMIDKANTELSKKVTEALDKVAAMQVVIDALPEAIKAQVNQAVTSIKEALGAIAGQIQSLVYMPTNNKWNTEILYSNVYKYSPYEGNELTTKQMLTATYEVTPAELASTVTENQLFVNFLIKKGDNTYKSTINPDHFSATNGRLTWSCTLENDAFEKYGDYDYICVSTSVKQEKVIDGVNYGTNISSSYNRVEVEYPQVTDIYFTLQDGKDIYDGKDIETRLEWSDYKQSEKLVFKSYQPGFMAVYNGEPVSMLTPEDVAVIFDVQAEDITPVASAQETAEYDKKAFTVNESKLSSTVSVNTEYIDSEDKAKTLVGSGVSTTVSFAITNKGITHDAPVYYFENEEYVACSGNKVTASYQVVGKQSSIATIDAVDVVWNYYDIIDDDNQTMYKQYEFPEVGIDKDIIPENWVIGALIYGGDGETPVGSGSVSRVSSKLVKVTLALTDDAFPETAGVYTLKGEYNDQEKQVTYPFTMPININARPADTAVELTYDVNGSSTETKVPIAPVVAAFGGQESYFLGDTKYEKEALYLSYACNYPFDEADMASVYVHSYYADDTWSLEIDGEEIAPTQVSSYITEVEMCYMYDENEKVWTDDSKLIFANAIGYGHTYTVKFPVQMYWGQTFDYTLRVTTAKAESILETTGYVTDGVVRVGGSIVEGKYRIAAVTVLKYLRMKAGSVDPKDFTVKFSYTTEADVPFDNDPAATAETMETNGKIGCTGHPDNEPLPEQATFNADGSIKENVVSTWGSYEGLAFNVNAQLYNGVEEVGAPLTFKITTGDPVSNVDFGAAIDETGKMSEAKEIYLYQHMKVNGILDQSKNLVYYNPSVDGTAGYPWATTATKIEGEKTIEYMTSTDGNRIYDQNLIFGADEERKLAPKAYVGSTEVPFDDIAEIRDTKLVLKAQSAAATYKFEIPAVLEYEFDHNGVGAKIGTITVNIVVK